MAEGKGMDIVRDNSLLNLKFGSLKPLALNKLLKYVFLTMWSMESHATESLGVFLKCVFLGLIPNTTMGWSSHLHQQQTSREILMHAYRYIIFFAHL